MLVSEVEIADAMRQYMAVEDDRIEGAAGVAIAALLARTSEIKGCQIVVIICGGNISEATLTKVIEGP